MPIIGDIADIEALVDLWLALEANEDPASHAAAAFIGDLRVLVDVDGDA
jgi:hypothetical protein